MLYVLRTDPNSSFRFSSSNFDEFIDYVTSHFNITAEQLMNFMEGEFASAVVTKPSEIVEIAFPNLYINMKIGMRCHICMDVW